MSKIIVNVTDRKGEQHTLEGEKGMTLMQLIDKFEIANPYGICGGEPMCGTCHVYVNSSDYDKIKPMEKDEIDTLESSAIDTTQYSRLACQIELNKEYDNISVTIAPE